MTSQANCCVRKFASVSHWLPVIEIPTLIAGGGEKGMIWEIRGTSYYCQWNRDEANEPLRWTAFRTPCFSRHDGAESSWIPSEGKQPTSVLSTDKGLLCLPSSRRGPGTQMAGTKAPDEPKIAMLGLRGAQTFIPYSIYYLISHTSFLVTATVWLVINKGLAWNRPKKTQTKFLSPIHLSYLLLTPS